MKTTVILLKEVRENVLTPKGAASYVLTSVILSVLSYVFLANRELSLLDQGEMLYMIMNVVTGLAVLTGLVFGADAFAGEMERETLEVLLLTPASRFEIAAGKLGAAVVNWAILFAISVPYLMVVGNGVRDFPVGLAYLAVLGTCLATTFGAFAMGLSARMRSVKNALLVSFLVFLLAGSPIVLSASLRQSWFGRLFDAANPFAGALNTFDSVIVDHQGFAAQGGRVAVMVGYLLVSLWFLRRSVARLEV